MYTVLVCPRQCPRLHNGVVLSSSLLRANKPVWATGRSVRRPSVTHLPARAKQRHTVPVAGRLVTVRRTYLCSHYTSLSPSLLRTSKSIATRHACFLCLTGRIIYTLHNTEAHSVLSQNKCYGNRCFPDHIWAESETHKFETRVP